MQRTEAKVNVCASGSVTAAFIITRTDGRELSLSSKDHSLIEWEGRHIITDHGWVVDPFKLLGIIQEFLTQEENETRRGTAYRPETFTR
jgi:hypothetical protein